MCTYACVCCNIHMMVRGQLVGPGSLLLSCDHRDLAQVVGSNKNADGVQGLGRHEAARQSVRIHNAVVPTMDSSTQHEPSSAGSEPEDTNAPCSLRTGAWSKRTGGRAHLSRALAPCRVPPTWSVAAHGFFPILHLNFPSPEAGHRFLMELSQGSWV